MAALTTSRSARNDKHGVDGRAALWHLAARVLRIETGATGPEKVGRELARLPRGWHVLHAVPIAGHSRDIDHLVIGSRGIFTLDTKHHRDSRVCLYERGLWVDGHSTVYLHNSRLEAERASTLLTAATGTPVEVHAAIVFVDLAELTIKGTPPDVHVTTRRSLRNFLLQQPQRLTPAQVEHIYTVARNSATWQPA